MRIVYEGLRAGHRPPRGIKVSGGELSQPYWFEPHGEAVEVPEPDAAVVLALRPRHGRFRTPDAVQTPGGQQILPGPEDEPPSEQKDERQEPAAEQPEGDQAADLAPDADKVGEGAGEQQDAPEGGDDLDVAQPDAAPQQHLGLGEVDVRPGRRRRRRGGEWPGPQGGRP